MRRHGARAGAGGWSSSLHQIRSWNWRNSRRLVLLALVLFAAARPYRVFDQVHAERDHGHAHTAQDLKGWLGDGRHVHVATRRGRARRHGMVTRTRAPAHPWP